MAWSSMAWHGMAWHGMAWDGQQMLRQVLLATMAGSPTGWPGKHAWQPLYKKPIWPLRQDVFHRAQLLPLMTWPMDFASASVDGGGSNIVVRETWPVTVGKTMGQAAPAQAVSMAVVRIT